MQQLNNTSALQGQQHKRLPSRLILALFFLLPLVGWGQSIPTITTDANGNGIIDDNEKVLYLIQTNQCHSFYMIPNGGNVSTANIPNAQMLWYFLDADVVSGTQYYYIINNSTGKCIYNHNGNSRGISLTVLNNLSDAEKEKCKFKLVEDNSHGAVGFYNIDVKASQSFYGLNKQGGSVNYSNHIRLTDDGYIHDYSSQWKFIPYNGTFTWPAPPFTPSTNSQNYYYKIHNITNGSYYVSSDASTPKNVTISSTESDNMVWYFIEVGDSDPWIKYYYIVNPVAGEYMYYKGTATNGSDQSNAIVQKAKTSENEDRFQFIIVQTARVASNAPVEGCYTIIPKLLKDQYWKSNSISPTSISEGNPLGIRNGRGSDTNNSHWYIETFNVEVEAPEITYDNVNQEINITCGTEGASIYYTLDGSTPTSGSTLYEGSVSRTEPCTIRAIAVKSFFSSEVTTYNLQKVATPTFSLNTNTNEVTITSTTGASIYYSIGAGNTPSIGVNPYTAPFEFPYAQSNQPIKAIAVKEGWINSDMGQQNIMLNCYMPTFSFNNGTQQVTLSCEDTEATMYYTTNGTTPVPGQSGTTQYTGTPFGVTTGGTVKAIAVHTPNYNTSNVAELTIAQVATPTIQNNGSNAVSITSATEGATIYYEINGTPVVGSSPIYSEPLRDGVSGQTINAVAVKENMINSGMGTGMVTLQCEGVTIHRSGEGFVITCAFPSTGATLYYETAPGSGTPAMPNTSTSPSALSGAHIAWAYANFPVTVTAIATAANYFNSAPVTTYLSQDLQGSGTQDDPYLITEQGDVALFVNKANDPNEAGAYYQVTSTDPLNFGSADPITVPFSGHFDGGFCTLTNLSHALFNTVNGGFVHNVILKDVTIDGSGNIGAICNETTGASRIYNCGILPNDPNLTATSSVESNDGYCGGLVGLLDGTSRVINCFSFANIMGGTTVAGIVGYNNTSEATQSNYSEKTIVMNCMFYGEISGGTTKYPVYGGNVIVNNGATSINNYNYYRGEATFDDDYDSEANYNRSWPAEERNLRRFEYYRSIFNSNRRLCTWWVNGDNNVLPTDADVASVGIAKWVLDRSIAPYPVLKAWGKYPSVINPDTERVWDTIGNQWVQRTNAAPYQGKKLGTLAVTVKTGDHPGDAGMDGISVINNKSWPLTITDMDTLNHDFAYYKVQLPYYNEVFGQQSETDHIKRYYGNYTDKVVTGWKITAVNGNDTGSGYTFNTNWESGCNYANRSDKYKDLYAKSGRVFAQGGYYYVPEDVTSITIEAYWGTAIYMHGKGNSLDRVSVCSYEGTTKNYGYAFAPAGTLSDTWVYNNMPIYDDLDDVVKNRLSTSSTTVYDQAVVLVGNFQVQARNDISLDYTTGKKVTFMSADLDFDNEPDFCWQFQWRLNTDRRQILPVRFDFLPISELGLAIRHDKYAYAIGIFVPRGHFEITETAFMHTTQFEYMKYQGTNHQQPLILNGGQFEQIVAKGDLNTYPQVDHTRNIILGGHVWMKRFTPGSHTGNSHKCKARHCAISVMGGEYPEFYLSGLYRKDITTTTAYNDNPHCYTNGGRFGLIAGAGNEAVRNSVYFEIDHSIIGEFYGGGINANNPVAGSVNVVINNSVVNKYCGGPRIGTCQTVTTEATGTIFNHYFGGGNGGTNLYRDEIYDNNVGDMPSQSSFSGSTYGWSGFTPISTQGATVTYSGDYGYHAQFEFEVFNQSNGINNEAVVRTYRHWAQFGTTSTGDVTNTLTNCTVNSNFYGGGNLGNVGGDVTSTLTNCNIFGNAYGGGFSASIPSFSVHDKSKVSFPKRDAAGVCHNGSVGYRTDAGNNIIYYTWCYKNSNNVVFPSGVEIPSTVTTSKPAFQYNGKWYCYTTVSLEDLGAISGNTSITMDGNTSILGHVFGAGDSSKVQGNTFVLIKDLAKINGNVYGGGNMGEVGGHTKVVVNGQIYNSGQGTGSGTNPTND